MNEEELLRELERRQGETPDGAFAARLGVTRGAWWLLKRRRTTAGRKMLVGIGRAFPDLVPHITLLFARPIDSADTEADSSKATGARR